ncbi:Retrovirus-related Pol polyprotein from transposon TNT 1-94 [Cucumis melo var. makuwa]|uniref:Retrovirus-related Pol polyprotein from transposon TNT 1-94 n=1 Tax=Cucumis melo var. makuwa TaxID=1194695 RepID=A0A5D3C3V2_CUCMM|nr:Retrovirus-related Pol polyprotein from transposon TNT 1-94 [Cucumis melo var. makuwa]TYK05059.1 Retrovirus-related Pol polyprotein from transposon TNT 1-94 [Cucumis melo var. makuwa]
MKDMGETSYVIAIEIFRDRTHGLLGLSQKAYINKVLEKFKMDKCSSSVVPIQKGDKFSLMQCPKNELERNQMETIPYASIVGSLLYAQTCTRPDISFAMDMLGRYQNSDFVGCVDTRKSTFGYLFLLAEGAISWKSAKQSIIPASTMEAKFVAYFKVTVHGLWLRNFISGLGIVDSIAKLLRIYCDNSAAVFFLKYVKYSKDPLTKGLSLTTFNDHAERMGISRYHH